MSARCGCGREAAAAVAAAATAVSVNVRIGGYVRVGRMLNYISCIADGDFN